MKLLVCGGRDFARYSHWQNFYDREKSKREVHFINTTLDALHKENPVSLLICGMAEGADFAAYNWATNNHISVREFPADWHTYGKAAGPLRNLEMLRYGPDLVVAFPGGVGTAHMKSIARGEGVDVREYYL